jgi:hypothetical protein
VKMRPEQGIRRELGFGEVFSKTFELYRQDFAKYFVLFAVVGVIMEVITSLVEHAVVLPTLPLNPTPQQTVNWFSAFLTAEVLLFIAIFLVALVFAPIAEGTSINVASERVVKGQVDFGASVKFVVSKLLSIWALSIVVGIIVFLGTIALFVPGIILAIMFSLALPVLLIENKGVLDSMSSSRQLVGHRWGNTFAIFIVLGLIVVIPAVVVSLVSGILGGVVGPVVNGILSAFYLPLFPILMVVYYYSNLARITQPAGGQIWTVPTPNVQPGIKYCINCGTQLPSSALFCSNCGSRQN